ncbi:MAG: YifB family Mg chelatase-like AAA ATPase [Candidatus Komeilibacteria bacterium]
MLDKILTVGTQGLDCYLVEVEADVMPSAMAKFIVVGLAETMVQEAKERVRSACDASGLRFPRSKVVTNLAPADIRKEGSWFDLPIALSVLLHKKLVTLSPEDQAAVYLGELSLAGEVRPVKGVLNMVWNLQRLGCRRVYVPAVNEQEARLIPNIEIFPVTTLRQLVWHLNAKELIKCTNQKKPTCVATVIPPVDFSDIRGQEQAKRLLEIAAAGGHNIFFSGSPGAGKTLLAKSLLSIMPEMELDEAMEVSRIYSYAGLLPSDQPLVRQRPFRCPHHSSSQVSLVGGGSWPKPGEITLAHRGVLFLDELPEFPRQVLDALRQPLEEKIVHIARAHSSVSFPAGFMLVAAANPCTCGYYGSTIRDCICRPSQVTQYQRRISGPLLDRIDLYLDITPVDSEQLLAAQRPAELSSSVADRVQRARRTQAERYKAQTFLVNADIGNRQIEQYCQLDPASRSIISQASKSLQLSSRSIHKVIKVARTIADLAQQENIGSEHVLEALQYRKKQSNP